MHDHTLNRIYSIPSPIISGIGTPALLLRDTLTVQAEEIDFPEAEVVNLEQQFSDYYHLFLVKIARLPQEEALSITQERRLIRLFQEVLKRKRQIGES